MRSLLLFVLFFSIETKLQARSQNFLMAAMGDSITAATLADSDAKDENVRINQDLLEKLAARPNGGWIPFVGHIQNKATLSWASGVEIDSHYLKLQKVLEPQGKLNVLNTSIPGEKAIGMPEQADEIVATMKSGTYDSLKYVTLFIGANDACQGSTPEEVYQYLMSTFEKLSSISQSEKIRVFIPAIPNIADLGRKEIVEMKAMANLSCSRVRDKILKECDALTVWKTDEEYKQKLSIVENTNTAIQNSIKDANAKFTNLDIFYTTLVFDTDLTKDILAADCFHPNTAGQKMLSDRLWLEQPWF